MAYSVPSVRAVMTWEVPLTLASDTPDWSQSAPDCFHWRVYPVGSPPDSGAFQDALSLPLSCRTTFKEPGACTGSDLAVPDEAVLLVTSRPLKDTAFRPSESWMASVPSGAV